MALPIFVDSGAWFSAFIPEDEHHEVAGRWFQINEAPLITTDLIIIETLTLLRSRRWNKVACWLGEQLWNGQLATVYFCSKADLMESWRVFRDFSDKEWSFVDCSSKVVIEKLSISQAFAFDHHFSQFGSIMVVPDPAH